MDHWWATEDPTGDIEGLLQRTLLRTTEGRPTSREDLAWTIKGLQRTQLGTNEEGPTSSVVAFIWNWISSSSVFSGGGATSPAPSRPSAILLGLSPHSHTATVLQSPTLHWGDRWCKLTATHTVVWNTPTHCCTSLVSDIAFISHLFKLKLMYGNQVKQ